jgi:HK97 family phage major capsid protein
MITELIEKRRRLHEENVTLLKRSKDDGRDVLTAEEELEWQNRDAAIEALTKNITMRQRQDQIDAALAEVQERKTEAAPVSLTPRTSRVGMQELQRGQKDLEMSLRAWFLAGTDKPLTEEHRLAADRCGINLNNRIFSFNLRARPPRTIAETYSPEYRAQTITTTGGGYTIPDEMMGAFERALLWYGGMRQAATIVRTDTGAPLPYPTANDTGNVGAILDINTQVSNQDVTFGQLVLNAFKYSSKQVLVPVELLQDNAINLPVVLGEMLGERIGRIQNTHFTTGAGTTVPWGLATRATSGLAPTGSVTAANFTYQQWVSFEHSVDIAYRRQGAAWMMSDAQVAKIKQLTDGASGAGRPLWMPWMESGLNNQPGGGVGGVPGTFLGYPVFVNNDMVTTTTNGSRAALFGALQKYLIREVIGVTLLRLDERYADFHQSAFLAFARADGDLLNAGTNPVKYIAYTT